MMIGSEVLLKIHNVMLIHFSHNGYHIRNYTTSLRLLLKLMRIPP